MMKRDVVSREIRLDCSAVGNEPRGLQPAGALSRPRREEVASKNKVTKKIRPDCSAVGPNLGDYSPRVRLRIPAKKENRSLLQLSDKLVVCFSSS